MDITITKEIKPCPFCGGIGEIHNEGDWGSIWVQCRECSAEGSWIDTQDGYNENNAIDRWNNRKDSETIEFKIKVSKEGNINSYVNKPVLNRILSIEESTNIYMFNDMPKEIVIGIISDAVELDNCYELTIKLWKEKIKIFREFFVGGELASISIN